MGHAQTWLRRGVLSLLLVALLLATAVAVIMHTTPGAHWTFRQIDARVSGEISIEGLEGTLWRGLWLREFRYADAGFEITVRGLDLGMLWPPLLSGELAFTHLQADSLAYRDIAQADPPAQTLDLPALPLALRVGHGHIRRLELAEAGALSTLEEVRWEGLTLRGQTIRVAELSAAAAGYSARGQRLQLLLSGEAPLSVDIEWASQDGAWSGVGPVRGSLAVLEFQQSVSGPYPASVRGSAELLGHAEPVFNATVQWEAWQYEEYAARQGTVKLYGVLDDYAAEYVFSLAAPEAPQAEIAGTARGSLEGLSEFAAQLDSAGGQLALAGSLSWQPGFTATAQLELAGFNPSIIHPALSGRIGGTSGIAWDAGGTLSLSALELNGQLNGSDFAARGEVAYRSRALSCRNCVVHVGANRLSLEGQADEQSLALDVELHAPALNELWPGLAGSIEARGHLAGTPALPQFKGTLDGRALRFADWSAGQVSIDSRGSSPQALDLDFTLNSLAFTEREFGSVKGKARGAPKDFELSLDWAFGQAGALAEMQIRPSARGIEGLLRSATVTESFSGAWKLQSQAGFEMDAHAARVDAMDWRSPQGRLQLQHFSRAGGDLTVAATLDDWPLGVFSPLLPSGYSIGGSAHAALDLGLRSGQWRGSVQWRQSDTVLRVEQVNREVVNIRVPRVELGAELADGGAVLNALLSIDPGVSGSLELRLEHLSRDTPLEAVLELQGEDWAWVPAIVPQLDQVAGRVSARFLASGPLDAPVLSGSMQWRDGALAVPALNVLFTDIELNVAGAPGGAATLSGTARAGGGELALNGTLENLTQESRSVNLKLQGDTAELLNWPDYRVWTSPDLTIGGSSEGWTVNGVLRVPRAEIAVQELEQDAVRPSPDVIIVGAEPSQDVPVQYSGEVRLVLGDSVHVQALGLDTRLEGALLLRQPRGRPLQAEGRVTLTDGTFEAYDRKLTIEEGSLTFTGPLDNPLVDVRAVRTIEAFSGPITAGIHLTGRALSLNSTIYSEPAMAEAEALSYLVLGQPLSQATSSEGSQLSNAALGLGLRQANRITDQLGRSVGLDQLTLAGDGGDGTALVAGKQLNERLYARYAYGVFSRLGTLLLRYRLSQRLTLEAGTGENQSIDLLYTVEKQ